MAIRVLDMFCGISAFRSAAEIIGGFEFVGYCDNDPIPIAAYRTLYDTKGEKYFNDAKPSKQMKSLISIFLSVASPANHSPLQEENWHLKMKEELCSLSLPEYLQQSVLHFSSLKMFPIFERLKTGKFLRPSSAKYQDWGMCVNGKILTAHLIFPKAESAYSLSDILIRDAPEKYYLSKEKSERLFKSSHIRSHKEAESTIQTEQP